MSQQPTVDYKLYAINMGKKFQYISKLVPAKLEEYRKILTAALEYIEIMEINMDEPCSLDSHTHIKNLDTFITEQVELIKSVVGIMKMFDECHQYAEEASKDESIMAELGECAEIFQAMETLREGCKDEIVKIVTDSSDLLTRGLKILEQLALKLQTYVFKKQ